MGIESFRLACNPFDCAAYQRRGLAYASLGAASQAVADYDMALTLLPPEDKARAGCLVNRAFEYRLAKEDDKAVADLRQALRIDPNQTTALNNLASLYSDGSRKLRDLDKALALARRAVELDPKLWTSRHTLGVIYYRLGRYDEALVNLERSLREGKDERAGFHLIFLAMCHARLGDKAQAKDCHDRALKWKPPHPDQLPRDWKETMDAHRAEADTILAEGKADQ